MKVALVYDRVNKIGGAERVLTALHTIWPEAPLYTAVYNPETASWASDFKVMTSFLQSFPMAKRHPEVYLPLTPLAFESFDFSSFDVVISVTSAEAKGIITGVKTLHLCYCLTPTRYLWSGFWEYKIPLVAKPFLSRLRLWDQVASNRPDGYLAISKTVAARINKYYRKEAEVIYPPVDTEKFQITSTKSQTGDYFLIVSRLVPYKRIDLAIEAFNTLGLPLKIIGMGSEEGKLKRMVNKNIEFLGQLTDTQVLGYYQDCQAVIFPGVEDFGLVPLEAAACGAPTIAYGSGGALETIIAGKTGELFFPQTAGALIEKIKGFKRRNYQAGDCRNQAEKFKEEEFREKFSRVVEREWKIYTKNIFTF
ncbi:MAG: glycosyltransferase [bacterium]|nr:glycosyltransferase [bacterium]